MIDTKRIRSITESLYDSRCNIYAYRSSVNEKGITVSEKVIVAENVPCRISYVISFNNIYAAEQSGTVTGVNQKIKLIISPEINIDEGSLIVINHLGRERKYVSSGIPRVYNTHQEIMIIDGKVFA